MKSHFCYLIAFAAALAATSLTVPLWRKRCLRTGLVDEPGERKIHTEPIPLAGGLAVLTGLMVPAVLGVILLKLRLPWPDTQTGELFSEDARGIGVITIFLGALGMLVLGVLDDRHELRPAYKFAGQVAIAFLVAAAGFRITVFVPSLLFSYAITVLWIVTVINAFNFMDNMNGLCSGLGIIGAFYFAAIAANTGQYLAALIAALTCGAITGFLPYNFPRARAFLGDAGSHLIGFLLAVLAILPHFHTTENPRPLAVLSPLLILAVPLGDLVRVVLFRWRTGKPFYMGDTNHLSHQLVRVGLSPTRAVVLIWTIAAAAGALALVGSL